MLNVQVEHFLFKILFTASVLSKFRCELSGQRCSQEARGESGPDDPRLWGESVHGTTIGHHSTNVL